MFEDPFSNVKEDGVVVKAELSVSRWRFFSRAVNLSGAWALVFSLAGTWRVAGLKIVGSGVDENMFEIGSGVVAIGFSFTSGEALRAVESMLVSMLRAWHWAQRVVGMGGR